MPTYRIRKLLLAAGFVLLATTGTAAAVVPATDLHSAATEKAPLPACDWSVKPPNQ